ncbi:unnamed protein product [Allacma fusca]|uniref:Uncharacterized protein n=1 Tax=Allacma fusca TaxID=39272 RepID=A0A8J2KBI7_9HEXA|nr:unnamed protein product [Allacma fusca]
MKIWDDTSEREFGTKLQKKIWNDTSEREFGTKLPSKNFERNSIAQGRKLLCDSSQSQPSFKSFFAKFGSLLIMRLVSFPGLLVRGESTALPKRLATSPGVRTRKEFPPSICIKPKATLRKSVTVLPEKTSKAERNETPMKRKKKKKRLTLLRFNTSATIPHIRSTFINYTNPSLSPHSTALIFLIQFNRDDTVPVTGGFTLKKIWHLMSPLQPTNPVSLVHQSREGLEGHWNFFGGNSYNERALYSVASG